MGVGSLSHAGQRRAGESRAFVDHVVEVGDGYHLDLGRAGDVDELSQDELDAVVLHAGADLFTCGHTI